MSSHDGQRHRGAFAIYVSIWALALVARAVYMWQIKDAPVFSMLLGDAASYDAWAQQIANGNWVGNRVFYQAPLYPYFLGALYSLFGRNLLAVRLVQASIGATSCILLVLAGRSFFSRNTGLLAGAILAVYPTAIFFDCSIQKSVLDLFFVCMLLATLGTMLDRPQPRWCVLVGAIVGLFALTRENALVLVPVILAWLVFAERGDLWTKRLQRASWILLGLVIVLLPVGFRNFVLGGEFHLTTSQFGPNFYAGNNKNATGVYQSSLYGRESALYERDDVTRQAERETGRTLTPAEVSQFWTAKALGDVREHFGRWLRLMGRKWLLVWNVSEIGDSEDQYTYADSSILLRLLGSVLYFGTICPIAVLGICLTWSQRRRLWVLYQLILGYAVSVAIFFVFARYRFPLVPMLLLFAAAGITCLPYTIGQKHLAAIYSGLGAALVTAIICNWPMVPESISRATTQFNIARNFAEEQSKPDLAVLHYAQAIRLTPEFAAAHAGLCNSLLRVGKTTEAIDACRQALRIRPDYPEVQNDLGVALAQIGQLDEAVTWIASAVSLKPDYAEAHYNVAVLLANEGKIDDAISHLESAVRLEPSQEAFRRKLDELRNAK